MLNARQFNTGNIRQVRAQGADGENNGVILFEEVTREDITAKADCRAVGDAQIENLLNFLSNEGAGQAEHRNALNEHAARQSIVIEERAVMPIERQVTCRGEAGGAGADDGDALAARREEGLEADGMLMCAPVSGGAFERADGDRFTVAFKAMAAGVFARAAADAAEDAGKKIVQRIEMVGALIRFAGQIINVLRDIRQGRARGLAGNVTAQPIEVFGSLGSAKRDRERRGQRVSHRLFHAGGGGGEGSWCVTEQGCAQMVQVIARCVNAVNDVVSRTGSAFAGAGEELVGGRIGAAGGDGRSEQHRFPGMRLAFGRGGSPGQGAFVLAGQERCCSSHDEQLIWARGWFDERAGICAVAIARMAKVQPGKHGEEPRIIAAELARSFEEDGGGVEIAAGVAAQEVGAASDERRQRVAAVPRHQFWRGSQLDGAVRITVIEGSGGLGQK